MDLSDEFFPHEKRKEDGQKTHHTQGHNECVWHKTF